MIIIGLFLNNEMRTGANRRYLELMESLAERGNAVYVIMNSCLEYVPASFTRLDIDAQYKRKGFPPASFLFARAVRGDLDRLAAYLGRSGDDHPLWVHIHGDMHLKAALIVKKAFGARLFFAFRCNDVKRAQILRSSGNLSMREKALSLVYESVNRLRERAVASSAELVTFQNSDDRDEFLERTGYPVVRTVIIPGNIGLPRFADEYRDINGSVRVRKLLYVGTLSVSKGFRVLLEVLAELKRRGHNSISLIVLGKINTGDGAVELATELGLQDTVTFEGYRFPFPYFARADLMVYPTLYDAFPDTILEALHAGCPVLASSVGGIPDLLAHEELLFNASDVKGVADKIERCVLDETYYGKIRKLCAERADLYRFDWAGRFEDSMEKAR